MDTVGIICSIIAAFAGIITVIFSYLMWRDSKRNICLLFTSDAADD